jgi:hypothetical protein
MGFDVKTRLSKLKNSAKSRGIQVNIDVNKYQYIIDQGCHFCGKDLSDENGYCLDRVDNTKGYSIRNVVPCCKICNRAKCDMDVFHFRDWVVKAAKNIEKQNKEAEMLMQLGMNVDLFDRLNDELSKELHKDEQPHRLKLVP